MTKEDKQKNRALSSERVLNENVIGVLKRFKKIADRLGDREFVVKEWFGYLKMNKIPFFIKIKWNFLITNAQGRSVNAWQLFLGLKKGEKRILSGKREIFGLMFNVAGMRCDVIF